ncbi:hypothetical protein BDR04DRAFT_1160033 [Suillus decipiens]|nr:hypothetical protein BDR04DRAFT_1160033 [Suillus decipiens]
MVLIKPKPVRAVTTIKSMLSIFDHILRDNCSPLSTCVSSNIYSQATIHALQLEDSAYTHTTKARKETISLQAQTSDDNRLNHQVNTLGLSSIWTNCIRAFEQGPLPYHRIQTNFHEPWLPLRDARYLYEAMHRLSFVKCRKVTTTIIPFEAANYFPSQKFLVPLTNTKRLVSDFFLPWDPDNYRTLTRATILISRAYKGNMILTFASCAHRFSNISAAATEKGEKRLGPDTLDAQLSDKNPVRTVNSCPRTFEISTAIKAPILNNIPSQRFSGVTIKTNPVKTAACCHRDLFEEK